jgi:DNA-directed RNA polymerase subunit RPC12/RpoP
MAFKCDSCGKEFSNAKMAGIVVGHIFKGISGKGSDSLKKAAIDGGFTSGLLTGAGVKCPNCEKSNWK